MDAERKRFTVSGDGLHILDDDFTYDAKLRVSGDFGENVERLNYSQGLCDMLNAALAHREGMQPGRSRLTDGQIAAVMLTAFPRTKCFSAYLSFARAIEAAVLQSASGCRRTEGLR